MTRALRALLTLVVAGAFGLVGASSASASATGASTISPFSYVDPSGATKSVPRGCMLIHSIIGEGTDLQQQTVNVDCAGIAALRNGLFCDVRVVFAFSGTDGTFRKDENTTSGCRTLGVRIYNPEMPTDLESGGTACARLYVGGALRAQSCHVVG